MLLLLVCAAGVVRREGGFRCFPLCVARHACRLVSSFSGTWLFHLGASDHQPESRVVCHVTMQGVTTEAIFLKIGFVGRFAMTWRSD